MSDITRRRISVTKTCLVVAEGAALAVDIVGEN
jgi:hypothetical protein